MKKSNISSLVVRLAGILALALCFMACFEQTATAGLPVEQVMREYQGRYYFLYGFYVPWQDCQCGSPAPNYPPDGFYGNLDDNPTLAVQLIQSVSDTFYGNPGLYGAFFETTNGVNNVEGQSSIPFYSYTDFPMPASSVTTNNMTNYLKTMRNYIEELQWLNAPLGHVAVDTNVSLDLKVGDGSSPTSCADATNEAMGYWTACTTDDPPDGIHLSFGVASTTSYDPTLGSYSASIETRNTRYAVDTRSSFFHGFTNGSLLVYLTAQTNGHGLGTATLPISSADGLYHYFASGSVSAGQIYYSPSIFGSASVDGDCDTSGYWYGWYVGVSDPTAGETATCLLKPRFHTDPDPVPAVCSSGSCNSTPGYAYASVQSGAMFVSISLGEDDNSTPAGYIYLNVEQPIPSLWQPVFNIAAPSGTCSTSSGVLTGISTDNVDGAVTTNASGYLITFTDQASPSHFLSSVSFNFASTNLTNNQITISNIIAASGNPPVVTQFNYTNNGTDPQTWTKIEGGGLRTETCATAYDGSGNPTDSVSVTDSNYNVVTVTSNYYQIYPWGKTLVEQTTGGGSAVRTGFWTYGTDPTQGSYGEIVQSIGPTGRWAQCQYDNGGRLVNQVSQFGNNSAPGTLCSTASANRETQITYDDTDGIITTVESLLGQEISRTYEVHSVDAYDVEEIQTIRCATPGASMTASDNLTNITWRTAVDAGSALAWDTLTNLSENGEMSFYNYNWNFDTTLSQWVRTTTVKSGVPNSTSNNIVDGTISTTVVGLLGETISNIVQDVAASGQPILSQDSYTYSDLLKRSYSVTHLDNTTEAVAYMDCCGITTQTDRVGVVTTNLYDAAKRPIGTQHLGITMSNYLDADGRILVTTRTGTDNSTNRLWSGSYDNAGFLVNETNALLGVTTHAWSTNSSGETILTTANPDSGTSVTTNYEDGTVFQSGGTAANSVAYLYGQDSDGVYTVTQRLSATGGTNEWTKSCTDFLGRNYKTLHPNDSGTVVADLTYYNEFGQAWKQVDPDSVTRLTIYNPKGEVAYAITAIASGTQGISSYDTLVSDLSTLESGSDRITYITNDVTTDHSTTVRRSRTYVWDTPSSGTSAQISLNEASADGLTNWSTVYDLGNTITTTNTSRYDATHYLQVTTNALAYGAKTVVSNLNGRLISTSFFDSNNTQILQTTNGYDPHGRPNVVCDLRNGTTTRTFTNSDQVSTITTPTPTGGSAEVTATWYDNCLRPVGSQLPDSTTTTTTYYPTGQVKQTYGSRTYPAGYGYDVQGRMTKMTNWTSFSGNLGGRVTTWNFNQYDGLLSSKIYDDGKGPAYGHDSAGRLTSRTWARGTNTAYAYGAAGNLVTVTYNDGVTPTVTNGYDRLGRLMIVSNFPTTCGLTYSDTGLPLTESYTNGPLDEITITNIYDPFLRRTTNLTAYNGTVLTKITNNYDAASRLAVISDLTNSGTYSYLANSPLVSQIVFKQGTTTRMTTSKTYDFLNRMTAIASVNASSTILSSNGYAYNSANQRTAVTNTDSSRWQYGYDSLGQVTSGTKYWSDNVPAAGEQFAYSFDNIGNRTSAQNGGNESGAGLRTSAYSVNDLNQYTSRTVPGAVDIVGSASTSASVMVNGQPAYRHSDFFRAQVPVTNASGAAWESISAVGVAGGSTDVISNVTGSVFLPQSPEAFAYDLDGNLLSDGRFTYQWDAENRLTNITSLTTSPTGSKLALTLAYDYMGRRISKVVSNYSGSSYTLTNETTFVYDGWNLVDELNPSNHLIIRAYLWGTDLSGSLQGAGGAGGLLAVTSPSTSEFPCFDGNGNITTLVDTTTTAVTAQYEYGPFGEVIRATGPMAKANPFRFSTEYYDDESDIIMYPHRPYSPSTGRWLSRDPVGELGFELLSRETARVLSDGAKLYGFCGNDPINAFDMLGLFDIHWKGNITDAQKQAIQNAMNRVKDRANALIKQMDDNIKNLKKCPCPAYDDLAKKLEGLKKVLQGMAKVINDPKYDLNVYVESTPGASATYWPSPVPWYNDHLTLDPGWFNAGDADSTMFHEISHSQGTEDQTANDYNNAHLIEGLMTVDKENWIIWKFDKKKADEKCKSGGK